MPPTTHAESTGEFFAKHEHAVLEIAVREDGDLLYVRAPGASRYIGVPVDSDPHEMHLGLEAIVELVRDLQ